MKVYDFKPFMKIDRTGTLHFYVPDFLDAMGIKDTEENRDWAMHMMMEAARKEWPTVPMFEDADDGTPPRPMGPTP